MYTKQFLNFSGKCGGREKGERSTTLIKNSFLTARFAVWEGDVLPFCTQRSLSFFLDISLACLAVTFVWNGHLVQTATWCETLGAPCPAEEDRGVGRKGGRTRPVLAEPRWGAWHPTSAGPGGGRALPFSLARRLRAGRRAPAGPAEPGWATREASPPQPPPRRAGAEAPRPFPRSTPGTAAPRRPRSSTRASLPAAQPGLSCHGSAAEAASWGINKFIAPLTPAAAREAGGGRGIRSSPS